VEVVEKGFFLSTAQKRLWKADSRVFNTIHRLYEEEYKERDNNIKANEEET
jgi:hypothetical protein